MKKRILLLLLLLFLPGCTAKPASSGPITRTGLRFDVPITITLYDTADQSILDGAFDLCAKYDRMLSRTDPESEVYALNHAGGEPVAVSPELRQILETAIHYAELTGGKYDITICPVVDIWSFTTDPPVLPAEAEITRELSRVGWQNIVPEGDQARLQNGAQIDLGSIGKGYIADRVAEYLRRQGVGSAIVNLGGNIMTVGGKPDGSPFIIGVQRPFDQRNETIGNMEITGRSVVSSGVYERSFVRDGIRYHHILDPATGYPAETGLTGVTVVTDHSVDGDALSTSLFLLGLEEGLALAERLPDTEAVFITEDGEPHFTTGFVETTRYQPR